jgi:hypothetical protein
MEVHHHSHTPRNKFMHYFWEFLMLFLAVFCGFLAEYLLEHKIEKEKGKQFAISFREDLCKDTALLNYNIAYLKKIITAGDSLSHMILHSRFSSKEDIKKLYEYNLPAMGGFSVILTDRTSTQLKNAGGMRLINKKKVVEGIISYWEGLEVMLSMEDQIQKMKLQAREKSYAIFNSTYYGDSAVNGKRLIADNAVLLTKDANQLIEFANRLAHVKNLMRGSFMKTLNEQVTNAESLIQIIDKEYHLN